MFLRTKNQTDQADAQQRDPCEKEHSFSAGGFGRILFITDSPRLY